MKKSETKADASKEYVAALDTMIEGKPTRKGATVKGLGEEKLQAYLDAGLIEEADSAETKEEAKVNKALEEGAKRIDATGDKRTEK